MDSTKEKTKKKRYLLWIILLPVCILLVFLGLWAYKDSLLYRECFAEAGIDIIAADFLKDTGREAFFTEQSDLLQKDVPGDYYMYVKTGYFTGRCLLHIQDTVAPEGVLHPLSLLLNESCVAEDFVSDIYDGTKVKCSFAKEPDFSCIGTQDVQIVLTDLGNNQTRLDTTLTIIPVYSELYLEMGSEPPKAEDFVVDGRPASIFPKSISTNVPQDIQVTILLDGENYLSCLHIVDTVPPVVKTQDLTGYEMVEKSPEEFVLSIEDETEVTVEYVEKPDYSLIGEQTVDLVFTDQGGNSVYEKAILTLVSDSEAPVIEGTQDLECYVHNSISYKKGIVVTDNSGVEIELEIDNSGVDLETPGEYKVVYRASDCAGNETTIPVTVTVLESLYDMQEVIDYADEVLSQIITEDMTDADKVWAIYRYIEKHLRYTGISVKGDWVRAAYEGFHVGQGDCFTYLCTARLLLDRAGIKNMDIQRKKFEGRGDHYWHLVDVGDGWVHLDTSPNYWHARICMWTDEELMSYSEEHNGTHTYEKELYPKIN